MDCQKVPNRSTSLSLEAARTVAQCAQLEQHFGLPTVSPSEAKNGATGTFTTAQNLSSRRIVRVFTTRLGVAVDVPFGCVALSFARIVSSAYVSRRVRFDEEAGAAVRENASEQAKRADLTALLYPSRVWACSLECRAFGSSGDSEY